MANSLAARYTAGMKQSTSAIDERQGALFGELPIPPPRWSDRQARDHIETMVETLEKAKTMPWSWRLLGWQKRRIVALAEKLTPLDAAALTARFERELERLGPPED